MGSPDSVSATMLLNSLIPAVCLLLVSNSHSLGLQGLKEQKAREGKKQVGLPCKTIVTEECSEKEVPRLKEVCEWYSEQCETDYVNECAANKTNNKREKRGVLQAILLTSAIASQNQGTTTEASPRCGATTRPPPPVVTTTTAPSMASAAQPILVIATARAEVPRMSAHKCPPSTAA